MISTIGGIIGIVLASILVFPFSIYIEGQLGLPYLRPQLLSILLMVLGGIGVSVVVGPLSMIYSAIKISRAETYLTMREGED